MVKGKFCKTSQYYENGCIQVVYQKYRDKGMGYFINGVINNDEKIVKNKYFFIYWYKLENLLTRERNNQA